MMVVLHRNFPKGSLQLLTSWHKNGVFLLKFLFCFLQDYQCSTDDLVEICELGRGAYGVVEKMRHRQTNIEMAVKVCLLYKASFSSWKKFLLLLTFSNGSPLILSPCQVQTNIFSSGRANIQDLVSGFFLKQFLISFHICVYLIAH